MRLTNLEDAGRTITGQQRDHNEDCFYIQTESKRTEIKQLDDNQERVVQAKGLYILCDGMGGHDGGEVASALAIETLRTYFETHWQDKLPNEASIREAIRLTNQAIYDQNQQGARSGSGRMGTTLVLLLLQDAEVAIAHVGDSRLYRFSRRRGLEQLTIDHEVGQREIQRGVEPSIAYARPDAYQLTQALGPRDENFINPDVKFLEVNEDMLFVLASDGLTDNDFLEMHWQDHLQPMLNGQIDLEQGVNQMVETANQFNGHDNITAVAIRLRVRPNYASLKQRRTAQ
jgi:serine/threonine protein phosphatase PrpC